MISTLKKYWYLVVPVVLLVLYMVLDKVVYSAAKLQARLIKLDKEQGGNPPADAYTTLATVNAGMLANQTAEGVIISKPVQDLSLMEKMKLDKVLKKLNV